MKYAALFTADTESGNQPADDFITVRDLPTISASASGKERCIIVARENIEKTLIRLMDDRQYIPLPTPAREGEVLIDIDPSLERLVIFNNTRATHAQGTAVIDRRTQELLDKHKTPENDGKVVIITADKDAIPGDQ